MTKVAKTVLFTFSTLLLVPSLVLARGIVIGPSQLGIIGKPGEVVSGIITVQSSRNDQQNDVRVTIEDFTRDEKGDVAPVEEPGPRSARPWIDVDQTSFATRPGEQVQVRVTAKVPQNASGSYWALVAFASIPPRQQPNDNKQAVGIQAVPRIAIPVIVTVLQSGEKLDIEIVETRAVHAKGSNTVECETVVENRGNLALLISGAFALEKESGGGDEELASVDISPLTSLPGTKLRMTGTIRTDARVAGTKVHTYIVYGQNSGEGTETVAAVTESAPAK